jgi:hypothetical protein
MTSRPAELIEAPADRIERIPFGARWLPDAFELFQVPGGFSLLLVDMTEVQKAIRILRDAKIPATYPHLIVRALGIAFSQNPHLAQFVCNYQRLIPGKFDVGLSMAGQTPYAPVVVLPAVDRKPLATLIPTIIDAIDAAAEREARDLAAVGRLAVPFRWLRRWILSRLHRNLKWRTRIVGHFQLTCLTNVDVLVPLTFYSNAVIGVGAIRDRVVVIDGKPVVRPTVWLSGVADHAVIDGMRGGDGLAVIKQILEGDLLVREAEEAAALKAMQRKGDGDRNLPAGDPSIAATPSDNT